MITSAALKPIQHTVYYGNIVHTPSFGELELLHNARVGVDKNGVIKYVKRGKLKSTVLEEAKELFGEGVSNITIEDISGSPLRFFFPGFFDTHIHAPQYPNCGAFNNLELLDWMNRYTYPTEASFHDTHKAEIVYEKTVQRTLEFGTTFCAYFATRHLEATKTLATKAFSKGQRAFIARSCQNEGLDFYTDSSVSDSVALNEEFHNYVRDMDPEHKLMKPAIAPRSADQCSKELMKQMGQAAVETRFPVQLHMCESEAERKMILDAYPGYQEYSDIYNVFNLLNERTILGHCVKVRDHDLDNVISNKSGVAHCPTSNTSVGSGEAHIRKMIDRNVKLGLGTDISAGFSPSILRTAQYAVLNSIHVAMKSKNQRDKVSVNECLYLATMGGAKVCNVEKLLGSFEVGKCWDAQFVDLTRNPLDIFDFQLPDMEMVENGLSEAKDKYQDIIDKWVFTGDDRNTRKVYVNGRCVINKD